MCGSRAFESPPPMSSRHCNLEPLGRWPRQYDYFYKDSLYVNVHYTVGICGDNGYSYANFNGRCYKVYTSPQSYADAKTTCQVESAQLAEPTSLAEHDYIYGMNCP